MKYLLIFSLFFFACNLNQDRKQSEAEIKALEKAHNDSIAVVLDSFNKTSIYVPPLFDKEVFDSATTVKFFELTKATQGEIKLLVNSKLITNEIINIIQSNAFDNADLLLLIDKTGSMSDDIENIQKGLWQIVESIKKYNNIRLAVALYGDKNEDADWFTFKNFETDYSGAKEFINRIETSNGGDYPESVYEGFFKACDQNFWKSGNKRMIILIGDAPPLEKPLSKFEVSDVIHKATESNITMNFYPIVVTPAAGYETDENGKETVVKTYEKDKLIVTVFPNPVASSINVTFTKNDTYSLELFNSTGALMLSDKVSGTQWKKDISSFKNGAYILRVIRNDKKFESTKVIVYK